MTDRTIGVALVGAGVFGARHLDSLARTDGVRIVSIVEPVGGKAEAIAASHGVGHVTRELDEALARPDVDAVRVDEPDAGPCRRRPSPRLKAGKHVQVEIPLCGLPGRRPGASRLQRRTSGKVAMCGHTRRFNPSHQWVHQRIPARRLHSSSN